ncbi:MAG TPA: glycoside hydrolase family 15 protein [Gaiellales bacterium]
MAAGEHGRSGGYAPLRAYAAIGDGRALALVATDGAIDWLCAPEIDGESVFGALLDVSRGGRATLLPLAPWGVERRYLPGTNVLETTFSTAAGTLRVTDAMAVEDDGAFRTIVRRIECLSGSVELAWSVAPRFAYGAVDPGVAPAPNGALLAGAGLVLRVQAWDLGEPMIDAAGASGRCCLEIGERALLTMAVGEQEPPERGRDELEGALDETERWWRAWTSTLEYDGPWRDAVVRSGLALKLLVSRQTGAVLAAGTTSLPEVVGGVRNWDYRYSWVRDSLLVLDALFELGRASEAGAYFTWLRERLDPDSGEVGVLYDLRGKECAPERELDLAGWCRSQPVRVGNGAAGQYQQSTYGTLLHACHLYADHAHGGLPDEQRLTILRSASHLAATWAYPDAGIWEERGEDAHHTHSKMMTAVGLHCASDLARRGGGDPTLAERLGQAAAQAAAFVEASCAARGTDAYARVAHGDEYDAAVLMPLSMGYERWAAPGRVDRTIDTIREQLGGGGNLLHRYRHDDGLPGDEGRFTPCSFWLASALAHAGRADEAAAVLDELTGLANDVGLYSEELGSGGEFLGNLPQAITHASLISAAADIGDAVR